MTAARKSHTVNRKTNETTVTVEAALGAGRAKVDTSVPFLDHMLTALARYSGVDLTVTARGDLRHHIIEDVALTTGEAMAALVPAGAARFGDQTVPMDDALVQAVLDVGGRPFYRGPIPAPMYDHWMRSFCDAAEVHASHPGPSWHRSPSRCRSSLQRPRARAAPGAR